MASKMTTSTAPPGTEFTNVCLENDQKPKKNKVPKKILHFSDGILEEYSTDEEEEKPPVKPPVDPKTLTWLPWVWHYVVKSAVTALGAADFCGEKLSWFFGITSPKYQHAIDEYYRLKEEEEAEKKKKEEKVEGNKSELSSINVESDLSMTSLSSSSTKPTGIDKSEYEKY